MKAVNNLELVISKEFSATPGPRKKIEGDFSGESLRKGVLVEKLQQAINQDVKLIIDLDGTAGYGTSFLEEAFGGLIRENGYSYKTIEDHVVFKSTEEEYLLDDIKGYMSDAENKRK